jgi:hypothetical protein
VKKSLKYGLIVLIALSCCISPIEKVSAATINNSKPVKGSTEELYQDIYITLLEPYIQEAVNSYYKEYFKSAPTVAPYMVDIISIDRPFGYRTFVFVIKVQVMPYFGPHNAVGIDNITLKIGEENKVQIEKYDHIKSFELPSNYQDEIIGKWPST